jgi:hypothetical protein
MRRAVACATFAAAIVFVFSTATNALAVSPPHWGGKGSKGAVECYEWSWWVLVFGWNTKEECEMNVASRGRLGFGGWAHPVFGPWHSTSAEHFTNATQSVECSELNTNGGFYKAEEPLELEGSSVQELVFSGCKVWEGDFKAELKECQVTTLEGGLNTGKSDVIDFDSAGELVYLNTEATKIGDLLTGSGKEFANLDFTGSGCVKSAQVQVLGEALAELAPVNEEVETLKVIFPTTAKSACWKFVLPATLKACETVKLSANGSSMTLSGNEVDQLTSKEDFGVFN